MPGYLVDEGGERTHAVIPVEEYERLRRAAENLETVREHANEIMAVISRGNPRTSQPVETPPPRPTTPAKEEDLSENDPEPPANPEDPPRGYGWRK